MKPAKKLLTGEALEDRLYDVEWRKYCPDPDAECRSSRRWLIFLDGHGVGEALAGLLEARGHTAVRVAQGDHFTHCGPESYRIAPDRTEDLTRLLEDAAPCHELVHFWCSDAKWDAAEESFERSQQLGCISVLSIVQAASRTEIRPPRMWLVTRGAQPTAGKFVADGLAQAPLCGLGRVLAFEHPELWGGLIDLEPGAEGPLEIAGLCDVLVRAGQEDQLACRGGSWFAARVARLAPVPSEGLEPVRLDGAGSYLITGGLSERGLSVADWMVRRGARHLVLMDRSDPERQTVPAAIGSFENQGVRVVVRECDFSNASDLREVFAWIGRELPELRGIVQVTAAVEDAVVLQQDPARLAQHLALQTRFTWHLHELGRGQALDLFVLFSSADSVLGSPARASCAAASAFLDALAHHRQAAGLPGLSIDWTTWSDLQQGVDERERSTRRLQAVGLSATSPEDGIKILERLLSCDRAQVVVAPIEWERYLSTMFGTSSPPIFDFFADGSSNEETIGPDAELLRTLETANPRNRELFLMNRLQKELAAVMGVETSCVDPDRGLFELGLESVMVLQLKRRLEAMLGRRVPTTVAFSHPTIRALARYFEYELLGQAADGNESSASPVGEEDDLEAALAEVEQLSEQETESLLGDLASGGDL